MDLATIKRQSLAVVKSRRKPILTASALFVALILIIALLSYKLTAPSADDVMLYIQRFVSRDFDGASKLLDKMQPANRDILVSDLLHYLQAIVSFGFLLLMLKAVRGEEIVSAMLLDGFGSWAKVLLLEILFRFLLTIGFMLLIFPGFWVLYSYRIARYLLLIHPEYGVIDCLRESRRRTAGSRTDFCLLDLSFLGWALLTLIPVLGLVVAVWLLPYWRGAELLFCEAINARFEPASADNASTLP